MSGVFVSMSCGSFRYLSGLLFANIPVGVEVVSPNTAIIPTSIVIAMIFVSMFCL